MNVLVIGAGAIGCLVGGKMAQAGAAVILVGRPPVAQAIYTRGLRITEGGRTQHVHNVAAVTGLLEAYQLAEESGLAYDLAIVTVKSYDTAAAGAALRQAANECAMPMPILLSLQNGVGNESLLASLVGADNVLAGTITAPVTVPEPGHVRTEKSRYDVGLSPWQRDRPPANLPALLALLRAAGLQARLYADARSLKWSKLLMNMVGNASVAILNEPPQQLIADPRMLDLEIAAWREALAVMRAASIRPSNVGRYPIGLLAPLLRGLPQPLLRGLLRRLIGSGRGGKMPSLQIDLARGKVQSEVAWLNGAIVREGRERQVPTPVNALLNDTLLTLINNQAQWPSWHHAHERLWVAAQP